MVTERDYYQVLGDVVEGGREIGLRTPDGSLVVVSRGNLDCRSPHLLYAAGRYGWSIAESDLQPGLLERLRAQDRPTLPSTIGLERRINPFLRCEEPSIVSTLRARGLPASNPVDVLAALRQWKNEFR